MFNDPLEQGVVCHAVHNDKVCAVRHVEDEGLDIAARLRVTGRPDANAQGVYINIPLTKGPMGQTAAVREGNAHHFVHVGLLVGSFRQCEVCEGGHLLRLAGENLVYQFVSPEGTKLFHRFLRCQFFP